MAINRIRQIKPDFFEDPKVATVGIMARFFFIGLWCRMDRNGVVEYNSKVFRGQMYPFDENVTVKDIDDWVDDLCNTGLADGEKPLLIKIKKNVKVFLWAPAFFEHQYCHHREKDKHALPLKELRAKLDDMVRGVKSSPTTAQASLVQNGLWIMEYGLWVSVPGSENVDNSKNDEEETIPMPHDIKKQISQIFERRTMR